MHTSAPLPPVTDLMYATGSVVFELTVWVAPNSFAHCELAVVDVDGDDRLRAGQAGAGDGRVADAAAAEHGDRVAAADVAGVDRRPDAGHHAAAEQAGRRRPAPPGRPSCTGRRATSVFSANAPMPSAGDSSVPSGSVIFCVAL